ncbi:MAG: Helix-turn-helix domain [Frankiaceae bacterium]|jgi:excisionase family DNA binding protein|nr:Helix-turn-helix domain [Frankiaceae bacterium]
MTTLLTVEDAAAELGTPVRFVRRLIQERRIRFHKIGKYVGSPERILKSSSPPAPCRL